MDRAPLPPHERPWRHPSELGPPEHEPTTTTGKALIVTTATFSLLLIGVLAISMTPDRSSSPETAVSTISGLRTAPAALERPPLPMVTPLGDGGWAVTTRSALAGRTGIVQARLPSGAVVDVEVGATDGDVTVVSLPPASAAEGYQLAESAPAPSDTVLVDADPPMVVTMVELAAIDVDEATPVLDAGGDLIGLCSRERDRTSVKTVTTMPDDGETDEPVTTRPSGPPTSVVAPPLTRPTTSTTTTTTTTTPMTTTTTTGASTSSTGPATTTVIGGISDGAAATTAPG